MKVNVAPARFRLAPNAGFHKAALGYLPRGVLLLDFPNVSHDRAALAEHPNLGVDDPVRVSAHMPTGFEKSSVKRQPFLELSFSLRLEAGQREIA